jgi:putative phosphoesterase
MSTKIGLISDLHATLAPAQEALRLLSEAGADRILCAGDIAGYGAELDRTIELLSAHGCEAIAGNHDLWYRQTIGNASADPLARLLGKLPAVINTTIAGRSLYMVHASPPQSCLDGIRLLDRHGNIIPEQRQAWSERLAGFGHDVLIVGHTHQVFAERLGDTLVINPGSTKFNHSCMLLSLPELKCTVIPLSGQGVVRAWNWGMETVNAAGKRGQSHATSTSFSP